MCVERKSRFTPQRGPIAVWVEKRKELSSLRLGPSGSGRRDQWGCWPRRAGRGLRAPAGGADPLPRHCSSPAPSPGPGRRGRQVGRCGAGTHPFGGGRRREPLADCGQSGGPESSRECAGHVLEGSELAASSLEKSVGL